MNFNTEGTDNIAIGNEALWTNDTGSYNIVLGRDALSSNQSGSNNIAVGYQTMYSNHNGTDNTAVGEASLLLNTSGNGNTSIGVGALYDNASGNNNTALGAYAGINVSSASNVICIGADGADASDTTWIGNIYGVTTQSGTTAQVVISDDGQLGTLASSERFKTEIASMDRASEAILALRPVTFRYKRDTKGTPQLGLIAEEVAEVNSALVLPDKDGKPYTVRYDAVNAMLLNEFLKEHRKNEEQQAIIARLKSTMEKQEAANAHQQKQIEALTAGLQKVSAQLELNKTAPQTVLNSQ